MAADSSQERYRNAVRDISDAIVRAQKPIRIIESLKWETNIEERFLAKRFTELPDVDARYYNERRPLEFQPADRLEEFEAIKANIRRYPGKDDDLGSILYRNCENYQDAVRMLDCRGTPEFFTYAKRLYGSPKDRFEGDSTTIRDLGETMAEILGGIRDADLGKVAVKDIPAETVVQVLDERFQKFFRPPPGAPAEAFRVRVMLDDGILADAAAGSDYVKIKRGVLFSQKEIDLLEKHEGWVHVGTTLNGRVQNHATWLSKGPPCVSAVQEGLAVFMELITFTIHPHRARKLNDRIVATDLAESGADFLEVCEFYRSRGYEEIDCYRNASRIFRGGVITGGAPFPKDIGYCKGMVMIYNFMRTAIRLGRPAIIPFLFAGKLILDDVPVLYRKYKEGVIDPPLFLPPQFRDLSGLAMWMAFSNFFNRVNLDGVREHYRRIIEEC